MTKTRILVVDDEPNCSRLVSLILEKTARFEVRVENRSALAVSAAREFRPHLILCDVDMPGKDGGELARDFHAVPALEDVPILFLTSLISRTEAGPHGSVRAGMRFLAKPVNPTMLIDTLDLVLNGEVKAA